MDLPGNPLPTGMRMRRAPLIWLADKARRDMLAEADARNPLETGGVLMGYRARRDEIVITAASGPGSRAVHTPTRFKPDHEHQLEWIAARYAASKGVETYLGDWHTHPGAKLAEPSWTDRRAATSIANCDEARADMPVMVIMAGEPGDWRLRAWTFETRPYLSFFSTRRFVERDLRPFASAEPPPIQ
jgi:integrative and conjugative element protein (TIGR02256 family)